MKELPPSGQQNFISDSFNDDPFVLEHETTSLEQLEKNRKRTRMAGRAITAVLVAFSMHGDSGINKPVHDLEPKLPPLPEVANIKPEIWQWPDKYKVLEGVVNPVKNKENVDLFTLYNKEARKAYGIDVDEKFVGIRPVEYVYMDLGPNDLAGEEEYGWHVGLFHLLRETEDPVPFTIQVFSGKSKNQYLAYFSIPKQNGERKPYFLGYYRNNSQFIGINNDIYEIDGETVYKYILDSKEELTPYEKSELESKQKDLQVLMEYVTNIMPASQPNALMGE
jgi:hypothetical protein